MLILTALFICFLAYFGTIFDRLTENDEFEYKRHRWNDVAYDIKIAE